MSETKKEALTIRDFDEITYNLDRDTPLKDGLTGQPLVFINIERRLTDNKTITEILFWPKEDNQP